MTETKKRMRRGMGRVEVLASRDKIVEMSKQGYSPIMIYEKLTEEGVITLSFPGFYDVLRIQGLIKSTRKRRPKAQADDPSASPQLGTEHHQKAEAQKTMDELLKKAGLNVQVQSNQEHTLGIGKGA